MGAQMTFFGVFFGQVWQNSGKNPSHPQKFACSYTYALRSNITQEKLNDTSILPYRN